MSRFFALSLCFVALVSVSACSGAKEQLGLNKKAPDEFQVLKRAPLALPPNYALRPPRPGAPRPQEQSPDQQAAQTVFGAQTQEEAPVRAASQSEAILLQQAGAGAADPNIRARIDSETEELNATEKTVAQKLLKLGGGKDDKPATVVDAEKEAERLQKNAEEGKPVTDGETPVIEE